MTQETTVSTDVNKDKAVSIYLAVLGTAGVALIAASAVKGWGFYGYGGGAFLMMAGFGGLLGKNMQGGFAQAPCPGCGEMLRFQFEKAARTMKCPSCGVWSEGTETMRPVKDDRLEPHPVFTSPIPEGEVVWPVNDDGAIVCPVCGGVSTGFQKVEGSDPIGLAGAMISPISVRTIHSIMAPVCTDHTDGVALFVSGSSCELAFRSRAYQIRFEKINEPAQEATNSD